MNVSSVLHADALRTALGPTVPEIVLSNLGPLHLATVPKTLFSMATPEVKKTLSDKQFKSVAIFGIEVRSSNAPLTFVAHE